jgi:GT2 family glycosyltransferase
VTLTAIVLNWRTPELTERAVRRLIDDGVAPERIVIVENGSADGSAEQLRDALPTCRILELESNVGFARGSNLGAERLPADAYLLVNSDAFVGRPGSVAKLRAALDDPAVGLVVPRLLNEDQTLQPSVVPISTPLPELIRASGLSRFVPNRLQPRFGAHWDHAQAASIQAAQGAVVLVRGSAWHQLGGFDESSFMYAEDLDLFRRAAGLGWKAMFIPEAEFVHLGGASATRRWHDAQRANRVARAEAAVVRRHLGRVRGPVTVGLMGLGCAGRALYHLLRGNRDTAREQAAWARGYLTRRR